MPRSSPSCPGFLVTCRATASHNSCSNALPRPLQSMAQGMICLVADGCNVNGAKPEQEPTWDNNIWAKLCSANLQCLRWWATCHRDNIWHSLNELRPSSRVASWVSLNELLSLPPLAGRCASETVRHPCTASPCCMAPGRAQSKAPRGPRAPQQRAEDNQSSPRRRSRRNFPSATFALRSAWITTTGRVLADSGYGFAAIPLMRMCPSLPVWRALLASL